MKSILPLACATLIAACSPSFQTTSGADYVTARGGAIDPEIAAAAAVEPDLQFPARIGLARLDRGGQLQSATGEELEDLEQIIAKAQIGTAAPLSPFALEPLRNTRDKNLQLRRIAARQHADYLLVYQFDTRGRVGAAQAAFIDVRNGYVYANASATAGIGWMGRDRAEARLSRELMPQIEEMAKGLTARSGS